MFKKVLLLVVLFFPLGLFAQDRLSYIDTLKQVEVSRLKMSTAETEPMPSQILKPADWADMNSATVADAVKYFSGVQVRDYGGIGGLKTIDVRNLGANHTTILYNGVAINNAQNGQVDLGKFSLDNVESISLYQGQPNSLLLPAKAFSSASALLLETVAPDFEEGKDVNIKAGFKTGSFGLLRPALRWEQKLASHSSLSFSSEYTKAHGEYDFYFRRGLVDTLVRRENSDIEALRLELGLQGQLQDSSLWNITLYHYTANRGLPGAAVDNRFFSKERQNDRDYFIQGKWQKTVRWYQLLVNAKHQYAYLQYSDPDFLTTGGYLENTFKQRENYISVANLFALSNQVQASLSADYMHQTLDANLRDFAYPVRITILLNAAAEWKWRRLQVNANALATFWNEKVEISEGSITKKDIGHSVSASWKPLSDHNLYVRAFHKSIFRAPTFNDMYYTLIGSTALKPEYVNQYNLGLTWQKAFLGSLEHFEFKVDAYHNSIKDRITAIPLNSLFRWSMVNLGKVDISGLDAGLSGRFRLGEVARLDAGINYTYQEAIDKTPNGATYNQLIPYTPKHSGAFFATGSYDKLSFSYNALYVGERYSLRPNTTENLMSSWLTHNIAASYQFPIAKQVYRIQAELNNLTNHNYQVIRSYPMPGLHYRVALQITY